MSKVTITDITPGATMATTDVTTTVDSWKGSSINGSNIRDEGLDERMFVPETSCITSEYREWARDSAISSRAMDYENDWKTIQYTSGNTHYPAHIGPLSYNTKESTIIVRFNAELVMPDSLGGGSGGTTKAVPRDPKMEIGYRLAYIISPNTPNWYDWNPGSTNPATKFAHTVRRVALSPYPRTAIGSSRYQNNICTTLILNESSDGRAGGSFPKPQANDKLWIGMQFKLFEYESGLNFLKNTSCYFTVKNANLNCTHYKR